MPLNEVQRKRLCEYVHQDNKKSEPVFVGRKDEIENIEDNIDVASEGCHAGRVICLSGPPGIGKTALLAECRRRSEQNNSAIWAPVCARHLHKSDAIVCAVAKAVAQLPADRINQSALPQCIEILKHWEPEIKNEKSFNAVLTRLHKSLYSNIDSIERTYSGAPWGTLECLHACIKDKPPLVIVVDEAQHVVGSDGQEGTINRVLHQFQQGRNVPIVPILAGDGQTPDNIIESACERFADGNEMFVGNLSQSESKEYVHVILKHLEAECDSDAIADWAYGESDGFPHHLQSAMSAIAQGMLDADSLHLADVDTDILEQRFKKAQCDYYDARINSTLNDYRPAVSATLKAAETPNKLFDTDIIEILQKGIYDMKQSGNLPPDPIDSDSLFDILVRQNVIARNGPSHYTCLIRSLARYTHSSSHALHAPFPAQKRCPRKE